MADALFIQFVLTMEWSIPLVHRAALRALGDFAHAEMGLFFLADPMLLHFSKTKL
jgi:hypothetical protein